MSQKNKWDEVVHIDEIMKILPHRYPFLMVDRIIEFEPAKRIVCIKNVTINEPFFQGHFQGNPVMPGVLLIETLAQAGAILVYRSISGLEGRFIVLAALDKVRFRRPVIPGDQIRIEARVVKNRNAAFKVKANADVDGEPVVQAELMAMMK